MTEFKALESAGITRVKAMLLQENYIARIHQSALKRICAGNLTYPLKLHLGCGPKKKAGWLNVDLFDETADLRLDLRESWPFPDRSITTIYSEHVFEHFDHPIETAHFLAEAHRVLDIDGYMDIGVPDSEWPVMSYADPHSDYWPLAKACYHPPECQTRMEHLNYHFRMDGHHKYAWDKETLAACLRRALFHEIEFREYNEELDSPDRRKGTIYVRVKPFSSWQRPYLSRSRSV